MKTNQKTESIWKINLRYQDGEQNKDVSIPDIIKVSNFINSIYEIRRNDVLMLLELKHIADTHWLGLTDYALDTLIIQLKVAKINTSKSLLESLFNSAYIKSYDSFKKYFDSLPEWDGYNYIDELANTIKAEDPDIWKIYLQKWLVAMVRCASQNYVTNQQMLVFFGPQGVGKTRWISKLLPESLRQYYFTGITNMEDQVFLLKLGTNILMFLDELDTYKGSKQAILKSTITQDHIKIRPLYNNLDVEVKRRASFIAAINHRTFLNDLSGSRRFLVVSCLSINHNHNIDMDKLFSQVYHLANNVSFRHYFDNEEIKEIESVNAQHKIKSDIEVLIEKYIEPCTSDDDKGTVLTATEILEKLKSIKDFTCKTNINEIGETMTKMGFERVSKNSGKDKRYGYLLKSKQP